MTLNSNEKHNRNEDYFETSTAVEDTNTAVAAVVYLVVTKHWVALGLDPDAGHRIVKYLVVLYDAKATVVHQDSAVLSAPDLIAPYQRVAAGSVKNITNYFIHSLYTVGGVVVECRTCDQKSWVRVSAGHYSVKTLGKFLTPMCICHQAVYLGTRESWGETDTPRDTLARYSWPHNVSWCLAEGYRKRRSAPPHKSMWLFTWCLLLLFFTIPCTMALVTSPL